jgi:hypothetical protein
MNILQALERAQAWVRKRRADQVYRMFGWWYRWQACKYAAAAMASLREDEEAGRRVWSYAVFFERYMIVGAEGTREDFGPKDPIELRLAK